MATDRQTRAMLAICTIILVAAALYLGRSIFAPFALVGFAAWLGRRVYRRHEEERLLAT